MDLARFIITLSAALLLAIGVSAANAYEARRTAAATDKSRSTSFPRTLRYENGLLDAHFPSALLNDVLREVARQTGAQFRFSDPTVSKRSVSAVVEAVPFEQGIRQILDGFSYVMCSSTDTCSPLIIVLSTPVKRRHTGLDGATATSEGSLAPTLSTISGQDPQGAENVKRFPTNTTKLPHTLHEFRMIPSAEGDVGTTAENGQEDNLEALSAKHEAHRELLLQRSLDALDSNYRHLHGEAVDALADIDDARAVHALTDLSLSGGSFSDGPTRARAVDALSRQAAHLGFVDGPAVSALEGLANDTDEQVRATARQALREMEQYQREN